MTGDPSLAMADLTVVLQPNSPNARAAPAASTTTKTD